MARYFALMPMMHSEDLATHRDGRAQFVSARDAARSDETAKALGMAVDYMDRHTTIIERFGRYPHRNAILGRQTTEAEAAFLEGPGSSF